STREYRIAPKVARFARPINGISRRAPTRQARSFRLRRLVGAGVGSATGSRSLTAGPFNTRPYGSKREPWQGQSQLASAEFQATVHLRCVQTAERSWSVPDSSR